MGKRLHRLHLLSLALLLAPSNSWSADPAPVKLEVEARKYLERMAEICEVPVDMVSTGPERDETIVLRHPFEA